MIDIELYKRFMGIASFPIFETQYYYVDLNQDYVYGARAIFEGQTGKHVLMLPSSFKTPRFLLFHELTHIYDMETLRKGEKNHDYCLTGYMEYHASQVELMTLMGADSVGDKLSFSMNDSVNCLEYTVRQYLDNKYSTAKDLIMCGDRQKRFDGLGAFYNFLGLKSICSMYSTNFIDDYKYQEFADRFGGYIVSVMINFMIGWNVDVEKAIALYSNTLQAML